MDKQVKALASDAVAVPMLIGVHKLLWAIDVDLLRNLIDGYLVVVTAVGISFFLWPEMLGSDDRQ